MITSNVDVSAFDELRGKILSAANVDSLLREISTTMLSVTRTRIHEFGENADGRSLGNYSPRYLELRRKPTSQGGTNDSDPKVRFFFTGQMQNDYKVVPLSRTEYALGFSNSKNSDKADWLEQNPKFGKVWALTQEELQNVRDIIKEYLATKLK